MHSLSQTCQGYHGSTMDAHPAMSLELWHVVALVILLLPHPFSSSLSLSLSSSNSLSPIIFPLTAPSVTQPKPSCSSLPTLPLPLPPPPPPLTPDALPPRSALTPTPAPVLARCPSPSLTLSSALAHHPPSLLLPRMTIPTCPGMILLLSLFSHLNRCMLFNKPPMAARLLAAKMLLPLRKLLVLRLVHPTARPRRRLLIRIPKRER